jgi:hypothetical protein
MFSHLAKSWIFGPRVLIVAVAMLGLAFALGYLIHPA